MTFELFACGFARQGACHHDIVASGELFAVMAEHIAQGRDAVLDALACTDFTDTEGLA